MKTIARSRWRDILAFSWLATALLYTIYAAATYTGLYQWLAERELSIFGSYDPTGLFLVLAVGSVFTAGVISPKPFGPHATWLTSATVDSLENSRRSSTAFAGIAIVSLLVGLGSAGLALSRDPQRHPPVELDLAQADERQLSSDLLTVTGSLQRKFTIVVEDTINGSTTRTAYTPLTSPTWRPGDPIQFVTRERLDQDSQQVERSRPPDDVVRFGPAAIFRHALPGIVRVGFKRSQLTLASEPLVLDTNLQSASETLWVVAAFAILFAVAFSVLLVTVRRSQQHDEAAMASERALSLRRVSPAPPMGSQSSGSVRRWELRLGGELLAELFLQGYEFPWIDVSVKAQPGMEPFWRGFAQEALDAGSDPGLEAMFVEIRRRGGFTLLPEGGAAIREFTLVNFDRSGGNLRY